MSEKNTVRLRELTLDDATTLSKLGNNINIFRYTSDSFPHPYTKEKAIEFINKAIKGENAVIFAIEWNGVYVGNTGLHFQTGLERKSVEIGYFIGEDYWGNGIASEAVKQICKYGFENLDINRIFAGVIEGNKGSMKVLERNGFELEGLYKKALLKLGEFKDNYRYGLLKKPD